MDIDELISHAYVPYSKNPSIAFAKSKEGNVFPGCRIENISYPLSIGAVQNALFCCLSEGDSPVELWSTEQDDSLKSFWEKEWEITIQELNQNNLPDIHFPSLNLPGDINIEKRLDLLLGQAVVDESNFPVAALVETESGFFPGVNIECSAWNMGLCAERVALSKALSYGSKHIKTLHIHTREGEFSSPCGACRQVIMEHLPNRKIHLHHADHSTSIHFSNDLLPHSFRSSTLGNR